MRVNFKNQQPLTLANKKILCEEKAYKISWKSRLLGGFIPFDCLISSKIFCFNALKIRLSFVKEKKKKKNSNTHILEIWKHDARVIPKILDIFFCPKSLFKGMFLVFWQRQNLVTSTVFQLWQFLTTSNKKNRLFKTFFLKTSMLF